MKNEIKYINLILEDAANATELDKNALSKVRELVRLKAKQKIYEEEIKRSESLRKLQSEIRITTDKIANEKAKVKSELSISPVKIESRRLNVLNATISNLLELENKSQEDFLEENLTLKNKIRELEDELVRLVAPSLKTSYLTFPELFGEPIIKVEKNKYGKNEYQVNNEIVQKGFSIIEDEKLFNELESSLEKMDNYKKIVLEERYFTDKLGLLNLIKDNYSEIKDYLFYKEELRYDENNNELFLDMVNLKSRVRRIDEEIYKIEHSILRKVVNKDAKLRELRNEKNRLNRLFETKQEMSRTSKKFNSEQVNLLKDELISKGLGQFISYIDSNDSNNKGNRIERKVASEIIRDDNSLISEALLNSIIKRNKDRLDEVKDETKFRFEQISELNNTLSCEANDLLNNDLQTVKELVKIVNAKEQESRTPIFSLLILNAIAKSSKATKEDLLVDELGINEEVSREYYKEEIDKYIETLENKKNSFINVKEKTMGLR